MGRPRHPAFVEPKRVFGPAPPLCAAPLRTSDGYRKVGARCGSTNLVEVVDGVALPLPKELEGNDRWRSLRDEA